MTARILKGQVVSAKMQKTVVVAVKTAKRHPVYSKVLTSSKKYKAHDEMGAKENDIVEIMECRPYGKNVTWKVVKINNEGETK